jgi:uncharacterized membrane protein YsdA (DUF1294 family)/cold shock CspA family protein
VRFKGKITDWNDDKGYGFVTPSGGGPRVFVHIKSFVNRQRRPVGNELVIYELTSDARGRPQGVNIAFVGDRSNARAPTRSGSGIGGLSFTVLFLALVVGTVAIGRVPFVVLLAYFLVSCATYLAYFLDKAAAQKGRWRTPESTLHLFSLVGGWPGALFAQRTFRHKTQKQSFQIAYWVTVGLNCVAFGWLLSPAGLHTVKSLLDIA